MEISESNLSVVTDIYTTMNESDNIDVSSFGQVVSDTIRSPLYILAILVPIQFVFQLFIDRQRKQAKFGKLDSIKITLTLLLTTLLSWQMSRDEDHTLSNFHSVKMNRYFSPRGQIATYILVIFLILMKKVRNSNMNVTLGIFWCSTIISVSEQFYQNIKADAYEEDTFSYWTDITHIIIAFLECILLYVDRKERYPETTKTTKKIEHPEDRASILSDVILHWTFGIIQIGAKRTVEESDVWDLPSKDKCHNAIATFEKNLKIEEYQMELEKERLGKNVTASDDSDMEKMKEDAVESKRISLAKILLKTFGYRYFFYQFLKAMAELMEFVGPILMTAFMNYIKNRENEQWYNGVVIVMASFSLNTLTHISHHRIWVSINRLSKRIRSSIMMTVFKKSLSVRNECTKDITTGEIVNLISDDCDRVVGASQEIFQIAASPLMIGLSLYLLYGLVGSAMFLGLFIMLSLIPLNTYVGKKIKKLHSEKTEAKDKRVKLMNEIINGIKVLKLYAWEPSFMKKVKEIRNQEDKCNNSLGLLHAGIMLMFRAIPFLVQLGSFGLFLFLGGEMNAVTVFVTMRLFQILNHPFSLMALLIPRYVEAVVSLKRIEDFLNGEDIPHDVVTKIYDGKTAISVSNGHFSWETNKESANLRDINLKIPKGGLVAIVGMVGSGKSSLLSALLGEMEKGNGSVEVQGRVTYVPQEAWILNAPLQENILYGSAMESNRYKKVVHACALKDDINVMDAGDKTEIGEKGINLSGGQKQRVSLARAVYSNSDVYLLDDPLSAVDSHVGKHIFNKVISDKGVLKDKTRVLVTHGIHWLPRVDSIIVLKDGQISESGTYDELISHDGPFAQFLRETLSKSTKSIHSEEKTKRKIMFRLNSLTALENSNEDASCGDKTSPNTDTMSESSSGESNTDTTDSDDAVVDLKSGGDEKTGALIDDEESEQGQVNRKVYIEYIKAVGCKLVFGFVFLYLIIATSEIFKSITLKDWTEDPTLTNQSLSSTTMHVHGNWYHFMWFALTGSSEVIFAFLFVATILRGTYDAATRLHDNLLYKVLRCPMSFFDTTPSGRIINRFSTDVSRVDGLGGCLRGVISTMVNMIICLCLVIVYCPSIAVYLIIISISYVLLFRFHIGSIRQLRRYRSKYRSPMYVHFTETLNGLSSIRAYKSQNRFIKSMENRIDEFTKFELSEFWCSLGLGIRSGFLYHLVELIAGLTCIMDTSMTAGMAGLITMYASEFTGQMNGFMWTLTHIETEIVSLERVIEYSNKPSEAQWQTEKEVAQEWPSDAQISFDNFKARYRDDSSLVLKGVNCQIEGGQKVGIVGRTAAGKTTLTNAFFRLLEAAEGNIKVDGVAVADIGLHDLRSRINILPQEPVIFSGSLRMNLDPFDKHSDQDIWTALQRSHMAPFVENLTDKLNFECGEGGKNLSVGQRQLLCLARTLLRKTKILVLDEATAAVDMETDELIQKTIRTEFKECTVLAIAHRLNTIMDYDKIMLMEHGTVKEFDSPSNLLADESSTFHSMAKDAKLV